MQPMADWNPGDDEDALAVVGRKSIGADVRAGRLALGLSQRQLAWRVGVTQSTISRLETGRLRGIRWPTFSRVVGVLRSGRGFRIRGEPAPPTRRLPGSARRPDDQ